MNDAIQEPAVKSGNNDVLLSIQDLRVGFDTYQGLVQALSGITVDLHNQKITGFVGETGCGKSVTAKAIMRLITKPGRITSGKAMMDGKDLLQVSEAEMQDIRGKTIAMIFQNPRAALNPVYTVEDQMHFILKRHQGMDKEQARQKTLEYLREVGLTDPERRLKNYPFELSTGMCQRVMIAMALLCQPKLLIADEPTTGIDVTIQAQILKLLAELVYEHGATGLLITHDLGVVAETCDYTAVMYAGQIVEWGETDSIFREPLHPYTQGLVKSALVQSGEDKLHYIPGVVPDLINMPPGCPFAPRCDSKKEICDREAPFMAGSGGVHKAKCFAVDAYFKGEGWPDYHIVDFRS